MGRMAEGRWRLTAHAAAALLALAALTACTPDPTPTPSPTGFASDEEAFAAAEDTYRAYIDALNRVELADPATFEPVYALLSNGSLDDEKKSLTEMHANHWTVAGASNVTDFFGQSYADGIIVAIACLDVSDVSLVDENGVSQVDPARPNVYAMKLEFAPTSHAEALSISDSTAIEDPRCAH